MSDSRSSSALFDGLICGVDATALTARPTGIGRYQYELLKGMSANGMSFNLYGPSEFNSTYDLAFPETTIQTANFNSFQVRAFWFTVVLPRLIARGNTTHFWGPSHRLPPFLPKTIARTVTIHDLVWKRAKESMRLSGWISDSVLMPRAIRDADRIIAVSNSTAEDIRFYFPDHAHKVRVIHLGVSLQPQPQSDEAGFEITKPYILFVGTLEPRKNLKRLLQAFSQLPPEVRQEYQIVIVGAKGWGGTDIGSYAKSLGLGSEIKLTGYVSDHQLSALYKNAYFLAFPSLYEGFGLPILEAQSQGIPVLTSNCASMPEVAGGAGVQVAPLDIQSIMEGLQKLLVDRAFRDRLAARSVVNASKFSWGAAVQDTMSVFEEAIAQRKKKHG